jgi:hypothetical protein
MIVEWRMKTVDRRQKANFRFAILDLSIKSEIENMGGVPNENTEVENISGHQ